MFNKLYRLKSFILISFMKKAFVLWFLIRFIVLSLNVFTLLFERVDKFFNLILICFYLLCGAQFYFGAISAICGYVLTGIAEVVEKK